MYILDNLLQLYSPLKIEKRMQYAFNIILVQGFCPLKIKITQFREGLRLKLFMFLFENNTVYVSSWVCI